MRCRSTFILLLVLLAVGCACGDDRSSELVRMVLPEGDASAGHQAFVALKCVTCHVVSGARDLPAPEATEPGPDLGLSLKGVSRGAIASSIIAPAHVNTERVELWTDWTAEERVWLGPGETVARETPERRPSRMANYAEVMTLRQLTDLVTFLSDTASGN